MASFSIATDGSGSISGDPIILVLRRCPRKEQAREPIKSLWSFVRLFGKAQPAI